MQVVVEEHRHLLAQGGAGQLLVPGAGAVYHHEGGGPHAIDDTVVDELARLVEHGGVDRLARVKLADVAGGCPFEETFGVGPHIVHLLQAGHIHETGFGADRLVFIGQGVTAVGVGPGRGHAVPVFQL